MQRSRRDETLNGGFDPRRNSLNGIRLVLAGLVIVSHSWALGGYGPEPELGRANLGTWAVIGFFGISGYLITRSRTNGRSAASFYWARFLRIYPAFIVCLVLVAFVFAPLSLLIDPSARFSLPGAVSFVLRNLPLAAPVIGQPDVPQTLMTVPYPQAWDGPLWTLYYEAACYILIGVAVSVIPKLRMRGVIVGLFVLTTLIAVAGETVYHENVVLLRGSELTAAFLAGALCWLYGDRIRVSPLLYVAAALLLVVTILVGLVAPLGPLPLAFLVIRAGSVLPLHRVGDRFDISYGLYIYGWPIQQVLALTLARHAHVWVYAVASLALTWPVAFLSCVIVERPALRLKVASQPAVPVSSVW